jgi:uncharacterized repeat protein (TIGR02543 family)
VGLPAAPANASANVVPDTAFRACLNGHLDKKASAPITAAQLQGLLGDIFCYSSKVKSLEGAQYLTGLSTLYLDGGFSDLTPLSSLVNIDHLSVFGNYSTLTPLAGLSTLTYLSVGSPRLTSLSSVESLTNLIGLDIDHSDITTLAPAASLPNLTTLAVYDSPKLTSLSPLLGNLTLTSLSVMETGVTEFSGLSTLSNLESLGVSGATSTAWVAGLSNLRGLGLVDSPLGDLSGLAGLTGLTALNLSSAGLTDISALAGLTNLEHLDLSYNSISDISALAGMTKLTYLMLYNNAITDLSPLPSEVHEAYLDTCSRGCEVYTFSTDQSLNAQAWTGTAPLPTVTTVSGGTVKWKVKSGPAKISGGNVKYTKGGTVKLQWQDKCGYFTGVVTVTVRESTFKVSFDPNTGATPRLGGKAYKSKKVTLDKAVGSLPSSSHSTLLFDGWWTAQTGGTQVTETTVVDGSLPSKLYAHWVAPTSITGLTGIQDSYVVGAPVSKKGTFTLNFPSGATKQVNLSDKNVAFDLTTATVGTRTATITVKPSGVSATLLYTVADGLITLDPQSGAVAPTSVGFSYGKKLPKLPTPTRMGYSFKGWYSAASGGKKYASGKKATQTQSFTEYARWAAKTFTVKFDANGGKVSKKSKKVTYDKTYGALPTPTLKGKTFAGWFTAREGGSQVIDTTGVQITAGFTLYAHWT